MDRPADLGKEGDPVSQQHRRGRSGIPRTAPMILGLVVFASLGPAQAQVADPAAARADAVATRDEQAMAVVARMTERIAGAERLAMHGEIGWDVVQEDGRTLEFGATRNLVMRRPDRLRVELAPREGGAKRLLYDGSQLVLQDLDQEVYATVARSGPVDDVVAYAGERLGVPVALAEFLSPDLPKLLTEKIDDAAYVGEATIDGELCDHVSLRNEIAGMQLWVARKDSLPRRIAITYEHEEGQPQFRARFAGWDLAPKASDSVFTFEPPPGAERVAFAPMPAAPSSEEKR